MDLKAEIDVPGANGAIAQGNYSFDWVSPTEWREEVRFANYERLRVRDAKGYWQESTLDYQPALIYELSGMLDLKSVLRVRSTQTLGKPKSRERDGASQKCVAVKWPKATDRVLCFDDSNGALIAIEYPEGDRQAAPLISEIEFGAFHSVGGKLHPYEIRAFKGKTVVATVKTLEITDIKEVNKALFGPPANSVLWPQCDDMQDAEPADRVPIRYSPAVHASVVAEKVIVYAVVESDGSLSHVTVIHGAYPNLNTAVLEAVRRWRYRPAQCGQTPVRVETSLSFDFWP